MHTFTRSVGLTLASLGCAAAVALSTATSAVAANTALMVNGLGAGDLSQITMANVLGGVFASYKRINVSWPQEARPITGKNSMLLGDSIDIGAANLDTALTAALAQLEPGEHVTIVGLSAGALVVDEELRQLMAGPDAPDKSQLKVVVAADSSRMQFNLSGKNRHFIGQALNYTYSPPPETPYDTTVVTAEYDGFADFPDRRKPIAVLNAAAGATLVHVPAMFTDLSTVPSSNITTTVNSLGGVTTNYLIPTNELPLVRLIPALKPREAQLKKIIDSAYSRNDTPAPAQSAASAQPQSQRVASRPKSVAGIAKAAAAERNQQRRAGKTG